MGDGVLRRRGLARDAGVAAESECVVVLVDRESLTVVEILRC